MVWYYCSWDYVSFRVNLVSFKVLWPSQYFLLSWVLYIAVQMHTFFCVLRQRRSVSDDDWTDVSRSDSYGPLRRTAVCFSVPEWNWSLATWLHFSKNFFWPSSVHLDSSGFVFQACHSAVPWLSGTARADPLPSPRSVSRLSGARGSERALSRTLQPSGARWVAFVSLRSIPFCLSFLSPSSAV